MHAFVLGDTSYIDNEEMDKFRENGITHLFAISGMHISFLTLIFFKILSLYRVEEKKKYYITFILLLIFSFLSGMSSSVLRSTLFFFLMGMNKLKRINTSDINILLVTLSIILILDPWRLFSLSLILSFTVTFFLIYYSKSDANYIVKTLNTSILSFFASLPIIINMNYEINILSIFNNIIFVPLVSLFIYPLCMFNTIFPFLDKITKFSINLLYNLNDFCNRYAINVIIPRIPIVLVIIYYILFLLLKYYKSKKFKIAFLSLIFIFYVRTRIDNNTYIYFIDVGQGDSTLILYKNNSILIDTGGLHTYNGQLNEYLPSNMITFFKSLGITKIDYVFLTHKDFDHAGNYEYIYNNFKIDKTFINNNDEEFKIAKEFSGLLKNQFITIENLNNKTYDNENDSSLVLKITIYNKVFLFMADAGVIVEENIIKDNSDLKVNFLKVGHHGSETSTSRQFVDSITPNICLISVGKNNRYGHPSNSVIENLNECNIYRTDIDGSIKIKLNKNGYKIITCPP